MVSSSKFADQHRSCWRGVVGAVVIGAGFAAAPLSPAAAPARASSDVLLTGGHDAATGLGGGVALIMGPSMIATPSDRYLDTVEQLFLAPHGFTGTVQALTTPESPFNLIESMNAGANILTGAVTDQIAGGGVDAENPVVVFGYSQSAAFVTQAMQQLHAEGVPSDYVHFVLLGNPVNPNGGWLTSLDIPAGTNATIPILDMPLGNATPDDLYPTDIYTLEYDGYADHPHHPLNLVSLFNSYLGLGTQHTAYLGLTPEQVAGAVQLPTEGDGLGNYFMIPSESLPLIEPLRLLPVIGQPLYELLEPNTRLLVNLGYGSLTEGWNQGPANLSTPDSLEFFPPDVNWTDAMLQWGRASMTGLTNFANALADPATYQVIPLEDNPALSTIVAAAYSAGIIETPEVNSVAALMEAVFSFALGSMAATDPLAWLTGDAYATEALALAASIGPLDGIGALDGLADLAVPPLALDLLP